MKILPVTGMLLLFPAFAARAHPGHEPGAADVFAWSGGGLWILASLIGAGLAVAGLRLYLRRKDELYLRRRDERDDG